MIKKIIASGLLLVTIFLTFAVTVSAQDELEYSRESFENQSVTDDLKAVLSEAEIEGYKSGAGKTYTNTLVLHTMEYGYVSRELSDYGFYIYVFDPVFGDALTRVTAQMCLLESTSSSYAEFDCTLISKDGYFSKHRVELGEKASMLEWTRRVYKISGITAYNDDKGMIKESYVGLKYTYSGNMKGYGSEIDTLVCTVHAQDTIELETSFTYYRTAGSSKGLYWQNQINTVYFSVPNKYMNEYGKLSAIHHKYIEYETGPMVVTNSTAFNEYMDFLYEVNETADFDITNFAVSDFGPIEPILGSPTQYTATFSFNYDEETENKLFYAKYDSPFINSAMTVNKLINYKKLPFWFYDPDLGSRGHNEITVTSEEIQQFINRHPNIFDGTLEELVEYAKEKFPYAPPRPGVTVNGKPLDNTAANQAVDATRLHYINSFYDLHFTEILDRYDGVMDFRDTENIKTLLSYDISHSTYEKIQDFGLFSYIFGNAYITNDETISNIHPLAIIEDGDSGLSNEQFARKYLVNIADVTAIKNAYSSAKSRNETLFLFRFDISDYFAKNQTLYYYDTTLIDEWEPSDATAMVCMQSYYADFDIISLTFDKNGVETVIPVVHTPKDFVGDITTPSEVKPMIKWDALIGVVLGLVLLFLFRKPISSGVGVVAEGISKGVKWLKNKKDNDNDDDKDVESVKKGEDGDEKR